MHKGQTPTIMPPTAPAPVKALASLHAFLSLCLIKARIDVIDTRKPIAKVKISEIPNLNQFIVDAYITIRGIVL